MDPVRLELNIYYGIDKTKRAHPTTNTVADAIIDFTGAKFLRDVAGSLHVYKDGRYVPQGEASVKNAYAELLDHPMWGKKHWSTRTREEVVAYIKDRSGYLWEQPPLSHINLLNGVYDVDNEELHQVDMDWRSTVQIPITYDEFAVCPVWESFLLEVCPFGVDLLLDVIGLCMMSNMAAQTAIVLVGSGSNGKSTFLNGLQAAIGKENISSVSLHALNDTRDRFSRGELVGKLVNVFGDLPLSRIKDASSVKAIIGQDDITVERKYQQPFKFTPFCKLVFSCNTLVQCDDESHGYSRKFINIPFTEKFPTDPAKGEELRRALSSPSELSGLFNLIRPRLQNIVTKGLVVTDELKEVLLEVEEIIEEEKSTAMPDDSTLEWLKATVESDEGNYIPIAPLYEYYEKTYKGDIACPKDFAGYVRNTFPGTNKSSRSKRIRVGKRRLMCYHNIKCIDTELHTRLRDE